MKLFSLRKKSPPEPQRPLVIDATDDSFTLQVIERSHKRPVLVDFWAAWCGPCRQLGPVLEKLALEPDSPFQLVKLDTEHNPKSATRNNIQSIPAVKLFRNGRVVAEFTGALPRGRVESFLREALERPAPSAKIKGSPRPARRLEQAINHLRRGRAFPALVLLADFPPGPEADDAARLRLLAQFMVDMNDGDGLTGQRDLDEQHLLALDALDKRDLETAAELLLAARDLAGAPLTRDALIGLIALMGDDHPLSQTYREGLEATP